MEATLAHPAPSPYLRLEEECGRTFRSKFDNGEVTEWPKVQHWKCCARASVPRVRIPPSPQSAWHDASDATPQTVRGAHSLRRFATTLRNRDLVHRSLTTLTPSAESSGGAGRGEVRANAKIPGQQPPTRPPRREASRHAAGDFVRRGNEAVTPRPAGLLHIATAMQRLLNSDRATTKSV